MGIKLGAVSLAAIALCLPAMAQIDDVMLIDEESVSEAEEARQDVVVVTGSAIRGAAEDAALPINVYSAADLELQGSPTGLEFAKDLPQSGPTLGESNFFAGGPLIASPQFNLRGLGREKTLTLMNGRRMSQNLSNIPGIAIQRIEVLKDGAATIYGADAVGGVVNFITKEGFTGFEATANYRFIDGSDGDYDVGFLAGFGEGPVNVMFAAEWAHRSRLETEERDFSSLPYWENPSAWSTLTNSANYTPTRAGSFLASPLSGYYADFTQASCESQGGIWQPTQVLGPRCAYGYANYYNLVEDQDIYRLFGQIDAEVNSVMNFHADFSYAEVKVPKQFASPSFPTTRGPQPSTGATFQYIVPRTNPYVAEFEARSGASLNPLVAANIADGYFISLYRPFAHNGNPVLGEGDGYGTPATVDYQIWRGSLGLDGVLDEDFGFAKGVGYDFAITYNSAKNLYSGADYLGYRLQEALNGFGGPGCDAADLDPATPGIQNAAAAGQGGCQYFNPFSSSYAEQPELGLSNPLYVPGSENPDDLVEWLFDPRVNETITESITVDLTFDGGTGVKLPGGEMRWAVGSQWRQQEFREFVPSEFYNGATQCPYPGTSDCPGEFGQGPFAFLGIDEPDYFDQQGISLFGELTLPLFDNLNGQAAIRREEFSGGLESTVYKLSGKWQVFDPLALRASYGTNFTAPPIDLQPGSIERVVRGYTRAGGAFLAGSTLTLDNVQPEEATSWNVGGIWQSQGFGTDHNLSIIVDYFNIETEGAIDELASHNSIASSVFSAVPGNLADCSSPFISRITFNDDPVNSPGGNCVQGLTSIAQLNNVQTDRGNGVDQSTSGIDFQVKYSLPVANGDLSMGVSGVKLIELETAESVLDGQVVAGADDRVGFLNFSSIGFAAPEWRLNAFVNFNRDRHNARLTARYVSSLEDERGTIVPVGVIPGTSTPFSEEVPGADVDSSLTFDGTYVYDFSDSIRFTVTVDNILDEDPPYIRNEFGYDPRIASPLGRTFEFGVKASF